MVGKLHLSNVPGGMVPNGTLSSIRLSATQVRVPQGPAEGIEEEVEAEEKGGAGDEEDREVAAVAEPEVEVVPPEAVAVAAVPPG